jgi:acetoin utilization protein AcuB
MVNQKSVASKPKARAKFAKSIKKDELSCKDLMNKQVISAAPSDSIINAIEILQKKKIRHLPIIENERVVGIISDRDTRQVLAILQVMAITLEQARGDLRVSEFMASPVTTIESSASAMAAAKILIKNKIGCLPVMENGLVAGILTETDIMKRFIKEHGN